MAFCGLSTKPILKTLKETTQPSLKCGLQMMSQVQANSLPWESGGTLSKAKEQSMDTMWNRQNRIVLKNPDKFANMFENSPINTYYGKRHLGAAIGSPEFKNLYQRESKEVEVDN